MQLMQPLTTGFSSLLHECTILQKKVRLVVYKIYRMHAADAANKYTHCVCNVLAADLRCSSML